MKFVVYSSSSKAADEHLVEFNTLEELFGWYENVRENNRDCYGIELSRNCSDIFGTDEAKYELMIEDTDPED